MIGNRLQAVREFAGLGLKFAVLVTTLDILPAVVEYNVIVSKISETQTQNLIRSGVEQVFRDITTEGVPVVLVVVNNAIVNLWSPSYPAHWWSYCQSIIDCSRSNEECCGGDSSMLIWSHILCCWSEADKS